VNETPIGEKTLRRVLPQTSQTVKVSSVKAWTISKALPHVGHLYE
jgi:hypothetical protein